MTRIAAGRWPCPAFSPSYRSVGPWSARQTVGNAALVKVSGASRQNGSVGYRLRNLGLSSVYVTETAAGAAPPTPAQVTGDGQYVAFVASGQMYEGGLSHGDVHCVTGAGACDVVFQEIIG